MMRRLFAATVVLIAVLASPAVTHALLIDGVSSEWTPIAYGGLDPDPSADQQTGQRESDIVGTLQVPAIYTQFDDAGTVGDNSDDTIAFRFRMSKESNPSGFGHVVLVGIDATPGDGNDRIDLYLIMSNSGNSDNIQLYDPGGQANNSPNSTNTSAIVGTDVSQTTANYDWSAVDSAPGTGNCDGACASELDNDVDPDNNGNDFFLSFSYSFQMIITELENNGVLGVDENTAFSYVFGTSTQVNSFNQDIGGVDNTTMDGNLSWSALGATSNVYTASGTPIPEPGTALLVSAGLVALAYRARRQRGKTRPS